MDVGYLLTAVPVPRRHNFSCEKKRSEEQKRKGKIHPFGCRVPNNDKER